MYQIFRQTLAFLTIVPAASGTAFNPACMGRMAGYFPLTGLVCGLILALVWLILGTLDFSVSLKSVLAVTGLIILTRGFHLDGLADTADALLSHRSREEKLAIFKDPHLGTFGVLAIVLDVLLKVFLLSSAMAAPLAWQALILFPLWGRLTASAVAVRSVYARPSGGLAQQLVSGAGREELRLAALTAILISLLGGWQCLLPVLGALLLGFGLAKLWSLALGGVTGDLLGASVEIGEIFSLALISALSR
ncbi:MAG: adenosylcobinamide-GDP ribazoletransferase [Deltaproteobacteria bacterium]|jgi:adenosylcobinamide-GDP ribazoletransferase|nr:adenosylcobinamide-GDP ribazoletransferase [Deltaproteobacteria bacterium]